MHDSYPNSSGILIVDDSDAIRRLLSYALKSKSYSVEVAQDGAHALKCLQKNSFDLVLLDIEMPVLDGFETLKAIRQSFSESELPVIMVTSKPDSDIIVKALELGANDYLTKPIDFPVLFLRTQSNIERKHDREYLRRNHEVLEQNVKLRTAELQEANNKLHQQIKERQRVEHALRESEKRYRILYDSNPTIFFTLDIFGTVLSVNHFGAEILGYKTEELIGRSIFDLSPVEYRRESRRHFEHCLNTPNSVHRWETRKYRKDESLLWVRATAHMIYDDHHNPNILLVYENVTETHNLSEQLEYQVNHDSLTGLTNRQAFEDRLKTLLQLAAKNKSEHALCYLDLDQFKVINDVCGHSAGDELIRLLCPVLSGQVRKSDLVARIGGDEFGILMEYCSIRQARIIAENIKNAVEAFQFRWQEKIYRLSTSIGLAPIDASTQDPIILLGNADAACFTAKDEGRNRIHIWDPEDHELVQRSGQMQWVANLNQAIDKQHLRLFFQPIAPVKNPTAQHRHYELLIRMRDNEGNLIMPGAFLPAAERYNLATKLDRWVVDTALDWLLAHPEHIEHLHLCSINLSGQSLANEDFLRFIMDKVMGLDIPAEKLCFEVTETAAITNFNKAIHFIQHLKDLGCSFALDDFGSGLSSFAYLKNLPVDFLKIDGQFVKGIVDDPIDYAMVKSINEVGHVMGKKTIAEFVENEQILEKLHELGVDYAQGYGIGRPQPIDLLASGKPKKPKRRKRKTSQNSRLE